MNGHLDESKYLDQSTVDRDRAATHAAARLDHKEYEPTIESLDFANNAVISVDKINNSSLGVLNGAAAKELINNKDVGVEDRLQIWHTLSTKEYVMLFANAGVRDSCCLIHAESFVVYTCCAAKKEGYSISEYARGAQTLQFIYRIEKLLHGVSECGGTYMLVFFDIFQDVFDDDYYSGYGLLRQVLLAHCKANNLPSLHFKDWFTDPNWITYCTNNDPTCILVEDGSSFVYYGDPVMEILDVPAKGKASAQNKQIYDNYKMRQQKIDSWKFVVNSFVLYCLNGNITVGYLFDIAKQSTDYTVFLSFSSNVTIPPALLQESQDALSELYPAIKNEDEGNIYIQLSTALSNLGIDTCSLKCIIGCNFLRMIAEVNLQDATESDAVFVASCKLVFRVYMLHNYLLENLTLEQRCTRVILNDEWDFYNTYIVDALDFLCSCSISVVSGVAKADVAEQYSNEILDLFDGNLFNTLLHLVVDEASRNSNLVDVDFLNVPEEYNTIISKLSAHFLGESMQLYPIDLTSFKEHGIYDSAVQCTVTEPDTDMDFVMLDNAFVNLYFNLKGVAEPVKFKLPDNAQAISKFDELHWRDPAKISERIECIDFFLNQEESDKGVDVHKRTAKQEQRSLQRKTQFSFLLSKYLGSNNLHYPIVTKVEHHWLDLKQKMLNDNAVACSAKMLNSGRDSAKKKEPKVSAKAQQLRQKLSDAQESKKREADLKALGRFEKQLLTLFSSEVPYETLVANLLDYTSGSNRAVDLISDFKWLKSVLSLKEMQLKYLYSLVDCLTSIFNGCKLRMLKGKSTCASVRRLVAYSIRLVHDCFNEYKALIDGEGIHLLQKLLIQLGCPSGALRLWEAWIKENQGDTDTTTRQKSKSKPNDHLLKDIVAYDFAIPPGMEYEFQLAYMGDLMERTLGSTVDSRVLFKPDAWQKMLLDVIDERESALVVAPTSTGKTYICYYAMEQGLRLDDEGIVIYVSPNNALALQVTYEITARFSSKVYGAGASCAAVLSAAFLEKFHDPKWNCAQILVTVPAILERLLISMRTSERNYAKRIEFLILDEIHCISNIDTGPFLERVIHLSACPFLALSATVGNPLQFHQWLSKVERVRRGDKDAKVHYIYFDERFSDVKLELYSNGSLASLNPIACTSYFNIKNCGFPADFYVPAKDCCIFYKAIVSTLRDDDGLFDYLDPRVYFSGTRCITKRQYRYYFETLKREVANLVQKNIINEADYNHVISFVKTACAKDEYDVDDPYRLYPLLKLDTNAQKAEAFDSLKTISHDYLDAERFLKMLHVMDHAKRLPCLVFIFDRNQMEHVLLSVTQLLMRKQWEKYYGTPEAVAMTNMENKRRQDAYNMEMRQYEAQKKMRGASREQKEEQGIVDEEPMEMPVPPVDVAEDYDPEFNFYNRRIYINYKDEVDTFINFAQVSIANRRNVNLFVEALKRGIGIHHEGLPHRFTMLTETLLRLGFIRVILSGRSLAFGVNVPCKSVMFAGDNYELTPLMYKQMSGRCGRRGFDLSGHVVFWCITEKKIKQLQTAQLDCLCGYYSTTPSNVLVALSAFNSLLAAPNCNSGRSVDNKVRRLEIISKSRDVLVDPRCIVKRLSSIFLFPLSTLFDVGADTLAQHLRFRASCEILASLGFVDSRGFVHGCSEIAVLTRDAHPCNLVFAHFIQCGKLKDLLQSSSSSPSPSSSLASASQGSVAASTLVRLLSHTLHKKPLMTCILDQRRLLDPMIRTGCTSVARLVCNLPCDYKAEFSSADLAFPKTFPLLPVHEDIFDALQMYNDMVLSVMAKYLALVGNANAALPESRIQLKKQGYNSHGDFFTNYKKLHVDSKCRNPFVAIGGKGNCAFSGAQELYMGCPLGLGVTMDMIPTIESNIVTVTQLNTNFKHVETFKLALDNSYICDYWTHSRFPCIRDVNGLGQYAWFQLKKVITYLQLVKLVIKTLAKTHQDLLYDTVDQTLGKLEAAFNRI